MTQGALQLGGSDRRSGPCQWPRAGAWVRLATGQKIRRRSNAGGREGVGRKGAGARARGSGVCASSLGRCGLDSVLGQKLVFKYLKIGDLGNAKRLFDEITQLSVMCLDCCTSIDDLSNSHSKQP